MPREGHLEVVFAYTLKKKHNGWMVFDPTYPETDMTQFKEVRVIVDPYLSTMHQ
jgi:hypothetical protein